MAVPEGATKLGTVGIAYKGVYNELQTYKYANAVYYNGSTYIALIDNPAGFPSNDGVNWRYLAQGFLQQAISALTVIDESGILGEVDAEVNAQEFLSKIAELEQGLEDTKANKADILDTLEEIVANTQSDKVAGALAVKELNSNLTSLNKYEGSLLEGQNIEIYFSSGDYFEITVIGNILRMCKIIGQFRSNGTPDYWVNKPSESTIQVSGNTNRIIIGNPSGAGSIDIYSKRFKM